MLFTIFINDLSNFVTDKSQTALYADDSKVYENIPSIQRCERSQQSLDKLNWWSYINNMPFNASKCKVQTVTRKLNPVNFDYHLGDKILAPVKKGKDLGIVITNYLIWDHHILAVVSKANKILGFRRRIWPLVKDTKIRHSLYLSLVSVTWIKRLKSGLMYIFRSNIRLKMSKEKRQDGYYSKGKGKRSTRTADCIRYSTALLRQGNDKPDVLLQGLTW